METDLKVRKSDSKLLQELGTTSFDLGKKAKLFLKSDKLGERELAKMFLPLRVKVRCRHQN